MEQRVIKIETDILQDPTNNKPDLTCISAELSKIYGGRKILLNTAVQTDIKTDISGAQNLLLIYNVELSPTKKQHIKYVSADTGQDLHEYGKFAKHKKFIAKISFDQVTDIVMLYGVYPVIVWVDMT